MVVSIALSLSETGQFQDSIPKTSCWRMPCFHGLVTVFIRVVDSPPVPDLLTGDGIKLYADEGVDRENMFFLFYFILFFDSSRSVSIVVN